MHDAIELHIHDLAYGGDGVGRDNDGRAVFVPFTAVGDHLRVRLTEARKHFARGEIVEVLAPGPARVAPACPYFGSCGGCSYQHLADAEEIRAKVAQLKALLQRIGGLDAIDVEPIVVSDDRYGYRNRLTLHPVAQPTAETPAYGFRNLANDDVVPIASCAIAKPALNQLYGELTPPSPPQPLTLRQSGSGQLLSYYGKPPRDETLFEFVNGLPLAVPAGGFYQINAEVAGKLVDWLRAQFLAAPTPDLIDLYCGVGVFALALSHDAKRVWGIERDHATVRAARHNARTLERSNVSILEAAAERGLPQILEQTKQPQRLTMILDPPRAGCPPELLQQIAAFAPAAIYYVSCNAAALARDLKRLGVGEAYELTQLAWFDMFPKTAHFETVAVLRHRVSAP